MTTTNQAAILSQSYHRNGASASIEPETDALVGLSLAADLATLEMNASELRTLLFELQELRHSSTSLPSPSESSNATVDQPRAMDQVLSSLNSKLESVTRESEAIRIRIDQLLPMEGATLQYKHERIKDQINQAQAEADVFHEELKEDKWVTVFRTVSLQAEDMMASLDKILAACHDFVWDVNRSDSSSKPGRQRHGSASTASSASGHPKSGIPAMKDSESIQATLQSYISLHRSLHAKRKYYEPSTARVLDILGKGIQERSTKNGEVLRKYADLKSRHKTLQERLTRVSKEMEAVEELLKDHSDATSAPRHDPTLPRDASAMGKVLSNASPGRNGSPFRRLTKRLSSFNGTPPVPPLPSSMSNDSETIVVKNRESKFFGNGHRPTQSASLFMPQNTRSVSSPVMQGGQKPKWNISLRRGGLEGPEDEGRSTPRKSLGTSGLSAYSYSTPPSRSLSPALRESPFLQPGARPVSPSGLSSISGLSLDGRSATSGMQESTRTSPKAKPRPSSPASRIPAPSPGVRRFRSSTPFGMQDESDDESSMMSRALSPTPSNAHLSSSLPISSRSTINTNRQRKASYDPNHEQEILTTSSLRKTPQGRTPSRQSMGGRSSLLTPEPTIRAQAARINKMARPSLSSKKSYSTLSSASKPRPSVLASADKRNGMLSPTIMLDSQALPTSYVPNPVDVLDLEIADIVNAQPLCVAVERVDLPLNKFAASQQLPEDRVASYIFGAGKAVQCKLIERKRGNEVVKKVMCRIGGVWRDLELVLLDMQAKM